MKILFVINTLSRAGAEMAMIELMRHLPEHEVELFVLTGQGELSEELPEGVRLIGDEVVPESVHSKKGEKVLFLHTLRAAFSHGSGFKNLPYMVSGAFRMAHNPDRRWENLLWRLLSDGAERFDREYDLAVAYLEGGATYYVADHVRAKKKAAFVHVDYRRAGYFKSLDRDAYSRFDRIFAVSDEVRECFLSEYDNLRDRTEVFENIVDPDRIRGLSEEGSGFDDDYDGIRILTVGRLTPQKGYETAIEAMYILKSHGITARWYIAGEGAMRDRLTKLIEQRGLNGDFILLGNVDNPYPLMRECDIYVHATRFEGKSVAIREAKILGKPVAASDVSGNRELIRDGYDGVLCEHDPADVASAIERLIEDDVLRKELGRHAYDEAELLSEDIDKLTAMMGA